MLLLFYAFYRNSRSSKLDLQSTYRILYAAFKQKFPLKNGPLVQIDTNKYWETVKGKDNVEQLVAKNCEELGSFNPQGALHKFFSQSSKSTSTQQSEQNKSKSPELPQSITVENELRKPVALSERAQKQKIIKDEIDLLNTQLSLLYQRRDKGLLPEDMEMELKQKEAKKKKIERDMKILIENSEYQKRVGRPRLEEIFNGLSDAIITMASFGAAAHERHFPNTNNIK